MTKAKIVEFIRQLRNRLSRLVSGLLPRMVRYYVIARTMVVYAKEHPELAGTVIDAAKLLDSLDKKE